MPRDWHPEQIKAEIRMRGTTLRALSYAQGLSRSAATIALARPWPKMEAAIGAFLGLHPASIWPSRYDETGDPRRDLYVGRTKSIAAAPRDTSQKRKAA